MRRGGTTAQILAGLVISLSVSYPSAVVAASSETIQVAPFSSMQPGPVPEVWRETGFRRRDRTEFMLVKDGSEVVLAARSQAAVAGLVAAVQIDPREFPMLTWRWKVANLLETSDLTKRKGDDFPARVYVIFDFDRSRLSLGTRMKMRMAKLFYGAEIPAAALCYVWDSEAPVETIAPNAYSDRVRMIVVRSGARHLGQWMTEQRDVLADYEAAFGEQPSGISGIAVATDTDDTGESTRAWFGDLALSAVAGTESR